jgi:hypothetical protein
MRLGRPFPVFLNTIFSECGRLARLSRPCRRVLGRLGRPGRLAAHRSSLNKISTDPPGNRVLGGILLRQPLPMGTGGFRTCIKDDVNFFSSTSDLSLQENHGLCLLSPHTQKKFRNPCYQIGYCTEDISTGATLFCLQQHVLPSHSMR